MIDIATAYDYQRVIIQHEKVKDCVIAEKSVEEGERRTVAYVVCTGGISSADLRRYLIRLAIISDDTPLLFVAVTAIPLTADGEVDYASLNRLYIPEEKRLAKWQQELQRRLPHLPIEVGIKPHNNKPIEMLPLPDILANNKKLHSTALASAAAEEKQRAAEDLSYCSGGNLTLPEHAAKNLIDAFLDTAKNCSHKGMTLYTGSFSSSFISYRELAEKARSIAAGIAELVSDRNKRIILAIDDLGNYFPVFWGCILSGMQPVTVSTRLYLTGDKSAGIKLLDLCQQLNTIYIISDKITVIDNDTVGNCEAGVKLLSPDSLFSEQHCNRIKEISEKEVLFCQLTSGSTGNSKCIPITHDAVVKHIHASVKVNKFTGTDTSLNWLPMDHVVPLLTFHLKDIYLGCDQIIVTTSQALSQPLFILDLIEKHQINNTWAPNFAFRLFSDKLSKYKGKEKKLSSIKFFMNAGEQVTERTLLDFSSAASQHGLDSAAIVPAYGMAELATTITYQHSFTSGNADEFVTASTRGTKDNGSEYHYQTRFSSTGPVAPGVEIRIVDGDNQLLPVSTIGRLQVRGDVVTAGYLDNPEENERSFLEDGWFNTGDIGFIHNEQLYIAGREKEQIVVNGINYYCYEIEENIGRIDGVDPLYVACIGVFNEKISTESLVVFYSSDSRLVIDHEKVRYRISRVVLKSYGINPLAVTLIDRKDFFKTSSGKIQRASFKNRFIHGYYGNYFSEVDWGNYLPNWFFRKYWFRKNIPVNYKSEISGNALLVFLAGDSIDRSFIEFTDNAFETVIYVRYGKKHEAVDKHCYSFCLESKHDVDKYFDNLFYKDNKLNISTIVYLSSDDAFLTVSSGNTAEKVQIDKINPLLILLQSLEDCGRDRFPSGVSLAVIARCSESNDKGRQFDYLNPMLSSVVMTASKEIPWLNCRMILLPKESLSDSCDILKYELGHCCKDSPVIYSADGRWVHGLKPVSQQDKTKKPFSLKRGGHYLVVGGTGGIGRNIVQYLRDVLSANILVIGTKKRTSGVNLDQGDDSLFAAVNLTGRRVRYCALDVTDYTALSEVMEYYENENGQQFDGVFNLAANYDQRLLIDESISHIKRVVKTKVVGSWNLACLCAERNSTALVFFSSVSGTFGAVGEGAYAISNSFVECLSDYINRCFSFESFCFSWSKWDGLGMGGEMINAPMLKASGYELISPRQGINSLVYAMESGVREGVIGLNGHTPEIMANYPEAVKNRDSVFCRYNGQQASEFDIDEIVSLPLIDAFGTRIELEHLDVKRELHLKIHKKPIDSASNMNVPSFLRGLVVDTIKDVLSVFSVCLEESFITLGGSSIDAMTIAFKLQQTLGIDVSASQLITSETIAEFIIRLDVSTKSSGNKVSILDKVKQSDAVCATGYGLSLAQRSLWDYCQKFPDSSLFNMPMVIRLNGNLVFDALEKAFQYVVDRHSTLRTVFREVEGEPRQYILEDIKVNCDYLDLVSSLADDVEALLNQDEHYPFKLSEGPLFKFSVLKVSEDEHLLSITIHHIIFDGWSYSTLFRDLSHAYSMLLRGVPGDYKPELTGCRFIDYVNWESVYAETEDHDRQLQFWIDNLRGVKKHALPYDHPLTQENQMHSDRFEYLSLSEELSSGLRALSCRLEVSLFTLLLTILNIQLFSKLKINDFSVGTIASIRPLAEFTETIGIFVNALVLRCNIENGQSIEQLALNNKGIVFNALNNSDVSFGRVIEEASTVLNYDDNPFYQMTFVFQEPIFNDLKLANLNSGRYRYGYDIARSDLVLELQDEDGLIHGGIFYKGSRFSQSTVQSMVREFQQLSDVICEDAGASVSDVISYLNH